MNLHKCILLSIVLPGILWIAGSFSLVHAQKLLHKSVSVSVSQQPVAQVLHSIEKQGKFYFSYNSDVIPGDSLVTFSAYNQPLHLVLDGLLSGRYLYKETGEYIILQRAPVEKYFLVTGHLEDQETGKPVDYASVYSKSLLVSTLSNEDGSFRLKMKDPVFPMRVSVSKIGYADTTILINTGKERRWDITLVPRAVDLDEVVVYNSGADRTWLARLFVSSQLRRQSRNIGKFFVALPYQLSLTPGLGTHGRMSGQVTNKVSLNLIGGYTAGVNGVELAGVFNISRSRVRVVQMAGVFNIVSGAVKGVQMAGVHNKVMESVTGLQAAGAFNKVSNGMRGVQMAGAINQVQGSVSGLQMSGLANVGKEKVSGLQLGPINYAKNLQGVQIGVVNIADSSSGYSFGLINITKKGKGSVSLLANELVPANIVWKTGSRHIYSLLSVGTGMSSSAKAVVYGFGFGKDFRVGKILTLSPELVSHTVYTGHRDKMIGIYRLQSLLDVRLAKNISISGGPAIAISPDKNLESARGFKDFPPTTYVNFDIGSKTAGWLGWQAGISWNYGSVL